MKILIADDSIEIRKRVREIIEDLPVAVELFEASNGQEAIETNRTNKPGIIILDIQMPQGNGLDVLKFIRLENNLFPKIVMLTNYEEPQYKERCIQLGADEYLVKSLEFEKLNEVLLKLVEQTKILSTQ